MDKTRAILALQLVIVVLLGVIAYGDLTRPAPAPATPDYATTLKLDSLQQDVDSLQQDVDSLQQDVDSLQQDVDALTSQISSLQRALDSLSHVVHTICVYMPQNPLAPPPSC